MGLFLSLLFSLLFQNQLSNAALERVSIYEEKIENDISAAEYVWAYTSTLPSLCKKDLIGEINFPSTLIEAGITQESICSSTFSVADLYYTLAEQTNTFEYHILYLSAESDEIKRRSHLKDILEAGNFNSERLTLFRSLRDNQVFTSLTLPFDSDPFIHSAFFRSDHYKNLYPLNYYENSLSNWESIYNNDDKLVGLKKEIMAANIITASYNKEDFTPAIMVYKDFLNNEHYPLSDYTLRLFIATNYILGITGRYSQSLDLIRNHAIPLANYLGNEEYMDDTRFRLAENLLQLGKYDESNRYYTQLERDSSEYVDKTVLYTNIGVNYNRLGNNNLYLEYLLKALSTADMSNEDGPDESLDVFFIYYNLIFYYTNRDDFDTALKYSNEASDLADRLNNDEVRANLDLLMCNYYWDKKRDHISALEKCRAAENTLGGAEYYDTYIDVLQEKAEILQKNDQLDAAETDYKLVRSLANQASDNITYIEALIDLTEIELLRNNLGQALIYLDEIRAYNDVELDFNTLVEKLNAEANYLYKTGKDRLALSMIQSFIDQVINRIQYNSDSQTGFRVLRDQYVELFNLNLTLLLTTDQKQKALIFLDKIKTLNDVILFNSPLVKAKQLDEEELYAEQQLSKQIESLRRSYLTAEESQKIRLKTQIDRLSAQRELILSKVNSGEQIKSLPAFWAIQRRIPAGTKMIHFTEVGDQLYKSTLDKESVDIEVIDGESTGIFALIDKTADDLSSGATNLNDLYELSERLGIDNISSETDKLIIIPDNHLYRIPMDILPVQKPRSAISYGSAHYLIEDHEIEFYTSLSEFVYNQRRTNRSFTEDISIFAIDKFDGFANSNLPTLPYTIIEADWIRLVLDSFSNKKIYIRENATVESFKREIAQSRVVHVATHSEVSEEDPLFSTIYLNASSAEDNGAIAKEQALYAYELFNTQLNTELIVLNSCSSGSGKYMQGTGIMGITRALRYAGARSLALNLWSVNDHKAADLSKEFYSYIDKGMDKSTAMRNAKLSLLRSGSADPHYWGAYMLIGNPTPVNSNSNQYILLFGLFAAVVMTTGYAVRKQQD
ncbi:CHAT domain-containing protein [Balneola sp. MJW-20]|uniref:CHAT domain-containing protein n=1 Tax=Gracilimonas aurantiaca TaxID=3234185 RepID=UPI0034662102